MWRKLIQPYAVIITIYVFILIWLLSLISLNLHFLNPFSHGIKDYEITDIVYSRMRNQEIKMEDRIVIVNTGQPERAQIAQMLNRINAAQPKAIGLDVLFSTRKDPAVDSLLLASIIKSENLILASELENYREDIDQFQAISGVDSFFNQYARTGYVNFPSTETRTIRYFSPAENTGEGPAYSFATEIARLYDPAAVEKLLKRKKDLEAIHYTSTANSYIQFEPETILDTTIDLTPLLSGKIVLIGFSSTEGGDCPLLDKFYTPLNPRYTGRTDPDMYGIAIHANIIQMILDGKFINKVPRWLSFALALLCCYFNVLLVDWIEDRYPRIYHPVTRAIQVIELILLFFIISLLFYAFRVKLDFTYGTLGLALYYDVLLSYESFSKRRHQRLINKLPRIFRKEKSE
jgi:CHASE2 domain-containing sensor protein